MTLIGLILKVLISPKKSLASLKKCFSFRNQSGLSGYTNLRIFNLRFYFHPRYSWVKQWSWELGRCEERRLRFPLGKKYSLEIYGEGKTYLELVKGPEYLKDIDWILDEFDSSFNDLATASLRYHLDYSICDQSHNREKYEDIIERLAEDHPDVCGTPEQQAIYDAHYKDETVEEWFENINKPTPPAIKEIYADFDKREKEYHERQLQARIDFCKIMPGLWS